MLDAKPVVRRACWAKHPRAVDYAAECYICRRATTDPSIAAIYGEPVPAGTPVIPQPSPIPPIPTYGPGTELKALLAEFGALPAGGCGCGDRATQMDRWGVAGCRAHRAEIVEWLDGEWRRLGLWERLRIAARGVAAGFLHPIDPAGALVDEAIRRAASPGNRGAETKL